MIKRFIFILAASLALFAGCEDPDDPNNNNNNNNYIPRVVGTLEVEFRVPGSFLPPNRVLRADLSIAKNAGELYKGRFLTVANVYNGKLKYQFDLEPGTYYYQAGIICIAEGDSCSAANFPGGKFGMKWAVGTAVVKADQTTVVVPQFTN